MAKLSMPRASPWRGTGSEKNEYTRGITDERDWIGKAKHARGISVARAPPLIFGRSWDYKGQTAPRKPLRNTGDHPPGLAGFLR